MRVVTDPWLDPAKAGSTLTVHALKENKRPIGFAPWPEEKPKPKRKPATRRKTT